MKLHLSRVEYSRLMVALRYEVVWLAGEKTAALELNVCPQPTADIFARKLDEAVTLFHRLSNVTWLEGWTKADEVLFSVTREEHTLALSAIRRALIINHGEAQLQSDWAKNATSMMVASIPQQTAQEFKWLYVALSAI